MSPEDFQSLFDFDLLDTHEKVSYPDPLHVDWGANTATVVWMPGNGSKYTLLLSFVDAGAGEALGAGSGPSILAHMPEFNRGFVITFSDGSEANGVGIVHTDYMDKKIGLSRDTGAAFCAMITAGIGGNHPTTRSYASKCIDEVMKYA